MLASPVANFRAFSAGMGPAPVEGGASALQPEEVAVAIREYCQGYLLDLTVLGESRMISTRMFTPFEQGLLGLTWIYNRFGEIEHNFSCKNAKKVKKSLSIMNKYPSKGYL
jgi:hypothetical protein